MYKQDSSECHWKQWMWKRLEEPEGVIQVATLLGLQWFGRRLEAKINKTQLCC